MPAPMMAILGRPSWLSDFGGFGERSFAMIHCRTWYRKSSGWRMGFSTWDFETIVCN
jgi:hypothetical protein